MASLTRSSILPGRRRDFQWALPAVPELVLLRLTPLPANIYREDDKPFYHRGNTVLAAVTASGIALFLASKVYYMRQNRRRDARWKAMSGTEQRAYITQTKDFGPERLDFRFSH